MLCGFNWSNSILGERRNVDYWQVPYLSNDKDNEVRTLTVILIGLSIIFAGCGKRDIISGLPAIDKKEEPVLETVPERTLLQIVGLLIFIVGCTLVAVWLGDMTARSCIK
jgi:hypothetical protein